MPLFGPKSKSKMKTSVSNDRLESRLHMVRISPDRLYDISDCSLHSVPDDTYNLCRVFRKQVLHLDSNNLTSLTSTASSLGDFVKMGEVLEELHANNNHISHLPRELGCLTALTVLNLSHNQLRHLPDEIGQLIHLRLLNVHDNKLDALPRTIGQLNCLRTLNVSENAIRRLPVELGHLRNLQVLILDLVSMEFPPYDVCVSGRAGIMRFLATQLGIDYSEPLDAVDVIPSVAHNNSHRLSLTRDNEHILKSVCEEQNRQDKLIDRCLNERNHFFNRVIEDQNKMDHILNNISQSKHVEKTKMVDAISQLELHAQQLIDNTLLVMMGDRNKRMDSFSDAENLDNLLKERADRLAIERAEWAAQFQSENANLELKCRQISERSQEASLQILKSLDSIDDLARALQNKDNQYRELIATLRADEKLKENMLLCLIENRDNESCRLAQHIALIEKELAQITALERSSARTKQLQTEKELNDERYKLMALLSQLIDEKTMRTQKLCAKMLDDLRTQNEEDLIRYWLYQYANLMTWKPVALNGDMDKKTNQMDKEQSLKRTVANNPLPTPTAPMAPSSKKEAQVVAHYEEECVVCMANKVSVVLSPCGHVCVCENCDSKITACPLCRAGISLRIRLSP